MKIEEYKKKFIELFNDMEKEYGKCESVYIHDYETGTECTIEF